MRLQLRFILVTFTFLLFNTNSKCETFTFTGNGDDDLWTNTSNWDNYPGNNHTYYDNIKINLNSVCVIHATTFVHCNIDNFGSLTISSTGKLYAKNDIYVYNTGSLINDNSIYSYDRVFIDFNAEFTNNGNFWAYRDLVTQGDFTNSSAGSILSSGYWTNRGDITNDGYIRVRSELYCYDGIITNSDTGSFVNYAYAKLKGMINNGSTSNYGSIVFENTFTNNNLFTNEGICSLDANTDNYGTINNSEKIINFANFTNKPSSNLTNFDMSRIDNKTGSTMINENGSTIIIEQFSIILFRD